MTQTTHPVRRNPCGDCGRPTKRQSQMCLACEPKPVGARPERKCAGGCGKATTAQSGTCRTCEPTWAKQGPIGYECAVYAETPGDWVVIRGVSRWVPRKPAKVA